MQFVAVFLETSLLLVNNFYFPELKLYFSSKVFFPEGRKFGSLFSQLF
jgi:hypothetical protein